MRGCLEIHRRKQRRERVRRERVGRGDMASLHVLAVPLLGTLLVSKASKGCEYAHRGSLLGCGKAIAVSAQTGMLN